MRTVQNRRGALAPKSKKTLFTTSAYDNIDHNPSSITAKESFHGTGISVFQHPDSNNSVTTGRRHPSATHCQNRRLIYQLSIQHCFLLVFYKKDILVPEIRGWQPKDDTYTAESVKIEMDWLNHVVEAMQNGGSVPLSWSAYIVLSMQLM